MTVSLNGRQKVSQLRNMRRRASYRINGAINAYLSFADRHPVILALFCGTLALTLAGTGVAPAWCVFSIIAAGWGGDKAIIGMQRINRWLHERHARRIRPVHTHKVTAERQHHFAVGHGVRARSLSPRSTSPPTPTTTRRTEVAAPERGLDF